MSQRLALIVCLPLLVACPGEAEIPPARADAGGGPPWFPLPDVGRIDGGGGWIPTDTGASGDNGAVTSDVAVPQQDQSLSQVPGAPCPCAAPLHCVAKKCRKQCTSQPCNGLGGCAATEACVMTDGNVAVCVPGQANSQTCSADAPCAGDMLCLTTSATATTGTCFPTCTTKGATCPTGGTCYDIDQSACLFCY